MLASVRWTFATRARWVSIVVFVVVVALAVLGASTAAAQPSEPEAQSALGEPIPPSTPLRLRRSHLWASVHVVGVDLGLFAIGRISALFIGGRDYLYITPQTVWRNLTSSWEWDEDLFSVDQFRHPYQGSMLFNGARSNGVGFWGSAAYSFGGSMIWEVVLENEIPSLNDQITTPFGGAVFGEMLHRYARALRWRRSCGACDVLAAILDPMGTTSTALHGEAWALTEPPPRFGYLALGWNGLTYDRDLPSGERVSTNIQRLHGAMSLSYGLPVDPRFVPRLPMDYFDLLLEANVESMSSAPIRIHARGLLWGRDFCLGRMRAIGGLMGGFDFNDAGTIRVGTVTVGAGGVGHLPLGKHWFLQTSLLAAIIPYGAAGASVDEDMAGPATERDYHRGPGATQLVELKLARRGLGMLHANSRGFFIDGRRFQEGSEYVNYIRFGILAKIYGNSGIDVEGLISLRRANFADDTRDLFDSAVQLRLSYIYASDMNFGGGP